MLEYVFHLEREISKLARKGVKEIVTKTKDTIKIDEKNLNDYLGIKKFKYGEIENKFYSENQKFR